MTADNSTRVQAFAQPLYSQVREILLTRIDRGDWSVGDVLPNEFQLAAEFGVSVGTIRRAVGGLEEAGIVVRKQGRGTYLAGNRHDSMSAKLCHLRLPNGDRPVLSFQLDQLSRRLPTKAEASEIGCGVHQDVFQIDQTLLSAGREIGCERAIVAANMFPGMESFLVGGRDLYLIYSEHGRPITKAVDTVKLGTSEALIASRLARPVDQPFLIIERRSFASAPRPVEWRLGWYHADRINYVNKLD